MKYEMQLKITKKGKEEWLSIKPTNSDIPYQYKTELEALKMLDICYREVEPANKRIKKV